MLGEFSPARKKIKKKRWKKEKNYFGEGSGTCLRVRLEEAVRKTTSLSKPFSHSLGPWILPGAGWEKESNKRKGTVATRTKPKALASELEGGRQGITGCKGKCGCNDMSFATKHDCQRTDLFPEAQGEPDQPHPKRGMHW